MTARLMSIQEAVCRYGMGQDHVDALAGLGLPDIHPLYSNESAFSQVLCTYDYGVYHKMPDEVLKDKLLSLYQGIN